MKIFIIEDEPAIREELVQLLQKYGYQCDSSDDFHHIVQAALSSGANLILLDINLPYQDGFQVCREIRQKSNLPIIVLTSRNSDFDELMSLNIGADDYIAKPYNAQILLARIIIYTTEDGLTKIDATFDGDTVWLSIDQMAELFQRDRSVIGKHVRNIFKEGELQKESVWAIFAYTAADGKVYDVDYYNLDVIISVGYRVKSKRGTQFRIWATGILKEYMRKGFALDDERLKNLGGGGYFKELLERIRDIRASEKVFYRQVLEIYVTSTVCSSRHRCKLMSVP